MLKFLLLSFSVLVISSCKKAVHTEGNKMVIEVFAKNLEIPWGMRFLPNGDFLFCERSGRINLKKFGSKDHNMIMKRSVNGGEGGLLGLAIDPDFVSNNFIYIYETVDSMNRVVRLKLQSDVLTEDAVILSSIPSELWHNGGAIDFGPDGFLYVGTGDAGDAWLSQDKNSLAGKILRIDRNGSPAPGNPFGNEIWTYGNRNVQGFDWSLNGRMIATEHGPTWLFGWCCHDELNLIEPGNNYGWPMVYAGNETDTLTPPIDHSGWDTWAPSGGTFVHGEEWGDWNGNFVLGALRGERLIRFKLDATQTQVVSRSDTLEGVFLRLRNVIQAPDGSLLFSSSNAASSNPQPLVGDDKIYRLFIVH